jgi:hypothetical protein
MRAIMGLLAVAFSDVFTPGGALRGSGFSMNPAPTKSKAESTILRDLNSEKI